LYVLSPEYRLLARPQRVEGGNIRGRSQFEYSILSIRTSRQKPARML
jgi:hypothetical protein